jgi:hypothetical protein
MVTTKSIRASRRARRRPSAQTPLTLSDLARPAGSLRKTILSVVANQSAAELAGSPVTVARLRRVATPEEEML